MIWGYEWMTSRNTLGKLILVPHTPGLVEPLIYTASLQALVLNHPCENRLFRFLKSLGKNDQYSFLGKRPIYCECNLAVQTL